ncbi:MAG: ATP-dependent DNA helicase RecG, partial [Lachnospiraceae bacterium]|nr:ATP-dependent DNA helicase RecG [Lachnospiraceae bacterium]
ENEKFKDISDVKRVTKVYEEAFPDKRIATVTGSMKKDELEEILREFKAGSIHVLVATSVIEVGVSVPNASVIVLYNAERFGLAELHQLRGRVGRGSIQSMCVLLTEDKENVRIQKMLETTDGFEIAKADLENRGVGDILGTEQSGKNKYIELALKYPNKFEYIKRVAHEMITKYNYQEFLEKYEERKGIGDGTSD